MNPDPGRLWAPPTEQPSLPVDAVHAADVVLHALEEIGRYGVFAEGQIDLRIFTTGEQTIATLSCRKGEWRLRMPDLEPPT